MTSPPPFLQAQKTKMLNVLSLLGPHVRYIQKPDNSPCSITDSVKRFPKEEATEGNATSPPQNPPTNLTVVTVEGCPSFVILDWDKPLNDTVTGESMACGLLLRWEALIRWCFGECGTSSQTVTLGDVSQEQQVPAEFCCLCGRWFSEVS